MLTALNLRLFLSAIGPLANDIAAATGFDLRGIAWPTLLPMLLMGLGAFFAPALQQRIGARWAVLGWRAVLAAGSALRAWAPSGGTLVVTAAMCGLGVAFVQAVFPGVIKRQFPGHVAPVMGLYSAALMGGGALGALLTPLAAQGDAGVVGAAAGLARAAAPCQDTGRSKRPKRHGWGICAARTPGC